MMLARLRVKQFKATIIASAAMLTFVLVYLTYSSFSFQREYILNKVDVLQGFAERSMSRLQTNPDLYQGEDATILGDDRMQFVAGYDSLSLHLNDAPAQDSLNYGAVNLFVNQFGGLWSVTDVILVYAIHHDDQAFYAYFHNNTEFNDLELKTYLTDKMQPAIITASVVIVAFLVVQLVQISRFNAMVQELAAWADSVSAGKPFEMPPKIKSSGINYLAHTMNRSLDTFSHILEKEHAFARFSSHELRTQVAILSANMELLELIMRDLKPQERKVLNRMLSAIEDMKYQTDALLWLSKETEQALTKQQCSLRSIIEKSLEENSLYLHPEAVEVLLEGEDTLVHSHETLLQIACNNLVRNAFQNTVSGRVVVMFNENSFAITNENDQAVDENETVHGFGIGLTIVERIVEKLDLDYQAEVLETGRKVVVSWLPGKVSNRQFI